jgi:F-type H+-transporting ATPase subunit epsilon
MAGILKLDVVTPLGKLISYDVSEIQFPTAFGGYYGILPGHTSLLTPLGDGLITCMHNDEKAILTVFGGFVEINSDRVTILARESESADHMISEVIIKQMEAAEKSLGKATSPEEKEKLQKEIDVCKLKLRALELMLQ